ncbi:MAG: hypothetical protein ABSG43_23250 [Solirubrobacteraceae bacterium]
MIGEHTHRGRRLMRTILVVPAIATFAALAGASAVAVHTGAKASHSERSEFRKVGHSQRQCFRKVGAAT